MRKKYVPEHMMIRDGVYYYVRHIPYDLASVYSVKRLCFSLKTKLLKAAIRTSMSVSQRLEDYWLGLRLQNIDIPAIQVVRANDEADNTALCLTEACELYLRLKGVGKDKVFIRTATRNTEYVTKLLGDRPISSYSSNEAASVRDKWIENGLIISGIKRNFSTIRSIINLTKTEHGLNCSNAFARTYMPEEEKQKRLAIPLDAIRQIQSDCRKAADDRTWLIFLLSDSGML